MKRGGAAQRCELCQVKAETHGYLVGRVGKDTTAEGGQWRVCLGCVAEFRAEGRLVTPRPSRALAEKTA